MPININKIAEKTNQFSYIIFSPLWFVQFLYLIIVSFLIFKSGEEEFFTNGRDIVGFFTPHNMVYMAIVLFTVNIFLYKHWFEKRPNDINPFGVLNLIFLICSSVLWYEYIINFINIKNI